MLLLHDKDLQ